MTQNHESKRFFFQVSLKDKKTVISQEQAKVIYDMLADMVTKDGHTGFISSDNLDVKVLKAKLSEVMKRKNEKDFFVGLGDDIDYIKVKEFRIKFK